MIKTIEWTDAGVVMIDQLRLPAEEVYVTYTTYEEVADAIQTMVIRGAPAIGVAAAMGIALGVKNSQAQDFPTLEKEFEKICDVMGKTRPTAVNLFWAIERMRRKFRGSGNDIEAIKTTLVEEAKAVYTEDLAQCAAIAKHGGAVVPAEATVLTHCNAGALAVAGGYGTALGVIRGAVEMNKGIKVLCTETRPYLQGARLTAWELHHDGIDTTLITDNMVGHFMKAGEIQCVVVGADRIAANGDTANKIGTYGIAVIAKEHSVPFYVAAPFNTVDFSTPSGEGIPIEERSKEEVVNIKGVQIAPEGIGVRHPAFDVTPNRYITGIVTENGVALPPFEKSLKELSAR
jgi:methylthioribose-1-phosphate isomerase